MTNDLLFEIGAEEIPASYILPALAQMAQAAEAFFKEARLSHGATFVNEPLAVEDDHLNFVRAGVPSVDVIDLDNPTWHTAQDDLEHVSQKSLQIVGDVVLAALPAIEQRLK